MKKQPFNLHTHTWRCGHATGADWEYAEAAIRAGFSVLGFSEHIQYKADNGKYGRINFEDFRSYFSDVRELKHHFAGRITILCGLEAAYVPEAMEDLLELSAESDYVILGQHQGDLTTRKYCLGCDNDDVLQYAADIEAGLETGLYIAVAHPDFFMNARTTWSKCCAEASERICRAAKKHGVPLELNLKGSLSAKAQIGGEWCVHYPYRAFWEIAAGIGNEVIYGWDAHSPDALLWTTQAAADIVSGLPLKMADTAFIDTLIARCG